MVKIACLAVELASASASSISLADYTAACSSAISHANPWFGVSMVPFVDMGNHADDDPHVEFRLKQGHVVGTAIRSIPPNSEVYQSYGELGTADLMYRWLPEPCPPPSTTTRCNSWEMQVRIRQGVGKASSRCRHCLLLLRAPRKGLRGCMPREVGAAGEL